MIKHGHNGPFPKLEANRPKGSGCCLEGLLGFSVGTSPFPAADRDLGWLARNVHEAPQSDS